MSKVKVGVAWRRDGNGQAHVGDLGVFSHPRLKGEVEVYSLDWPGAPVSGNLRRGTLSDMDLLIIPGGPHANATQIPAINQDVQNKPKENAEDYAKARERSELGLIEQARTLGMPILALCGGSWRLVQNYGGSTVELAALNDTGKFLTNGPPNEAARARHAGNMNLVETQFKHPLAVRPGTMLEAAMSQSKQPPKDMMVNSVHWAVVRTSDMGTRDGLHAQRFGIVPNGMLQQSAKDPKCVTMTEAVESTHGAPVLGVQWHPEYQLPQSGGQYPASRAANLALIKWMIEAGRTYRQHREVMAELLEGKGETPKTAQNVRFRGAPVHTGAPGVGPGASAIPRHRDDNDTAQRARAELAVRRYLFDRGRKDNLFLTPVEVFNLASGASLSNLREDGELKQNSVVKFMNNNEWAQKYCDGASKQEILKWQKE
jgi:gamma-glutamyl-gamma-aminobutyrate hydrolase PuuD